MIEFFERAADATAEALAWRGGTLTGPAGQTVPVPETRLRPVCRETVRRGQALLPLEIAAGRVIVVALVRPGTAGRPPGTGVQADLEALQRALAAGVDPALPEPPARVVRLAAVLADELQVPLSVGRAASLERVRPAVLAQALAGFVYQTERQRRALGDQIGDAVSGARGEAWRFAWSAGWAAECWVGEIGVWGPLYQVFRRVGIDLSPFAQAYAVIRQEAAGRLDTAELARQARYFGAATSGSLAGL